MNRSRGPAAMLWALLLGGIGFAAGFFGPIELNPDANQGPLLGIFVTGPGGALAGYLLGAVLGFLPIGNVRRWQSLLMACVAMGLGTLYFCLPGPRLLGYVIEAQPRKCTTARAAAAPAIADWENRIAQVTWSPPRAGWKQDVERMLRAEPGVVLEMHVMRRNGIYGHRKPWNRGQISAQGWEATDTEQSYFAANDTGSCDGFDNGEPTQYFPTGEGSSDWPPRDLPGFLSLQTLAAVPGPYQGLSADH